MNTQVTSAAQAELLIGIKGELSRNIFIFCVAVSVFVCMLLVILASEELQVGLAGKLAKQVTSERKEETKGLVTNNKGNK